MVSLRNEVLYSAAVKVHFPEGLPLQPASLWPHREQPYAISHKITTTSKQKAGKWSCREPLGMVQCLQRSGVCSRADHMLVRINYSDSRRGQVPPSMNHLRPHLKREVFRSSPPNLILNYLVTTRRQAIHAQDTKEALSGRPLDIVIGDLARLIQQALTPWGPGCVQSSKIMKFSEPQLHQVCNGHEGH